MGKNQITQRKQQTCYKSPTTYITYSCTNTPLQRGNRVLFVALVIGGGGGDSTTMNRYHDGQYKQDSLDIYLKCVIA